jgi:L-seryl-tRNA(Ser) seleniumtransferase
MTPFRSIPSVDELVRSIEGAYPAPRTVLVDEARLVLAAMRQESAEGVPSIPARERLCAAIDELLSPSLKRVINATGVILHTNLGRAPLPRFEVPYGYSNLEYDLSEGRRGNRDVHVAGLLERVAGKPGIVVNNNAAAVYLVLNGLAAGHEAIVSRGELIEIGDGFRIPGIMTSAGATLREVGTTNRTRIEDYREAITDRTRLIMRVHPSNFAISGFTGKPSMAELSGLARERGIPLYEDLGSGCLVDLRRFGIHEPTVRSSLDTGVDLVSFSGDKLLGGPQAGMIAGAPGRVQRVRRNPMFRALRADKLIYAALESTLRDVLLERWDNIPAMRMIATPREEICSRAERLCVELRDAEIVEGESVIGGGSTPNQSLPTWLIRLPKGSAKWEPELRRNTPPVIARVEDDRIVIDLRTVSADEEPALAAALK